MDIKAEIESNSEIAEQLIEQAKNQTNLNEEQKAKVDGIIKGISDRDDPLYRVNCLQLISALATSKIYLNYLESARIPQEILTIIKEHDPLIIPHALKLFLKINPFDVEIKYPHVFDLVCEYFRSEDPQILDYGIDFVATIGREGYLARKVLERHPLFKRLCLPKLGLIICSSTPLLKSRALICIKDLLEVYPSEPRYETMALSKTFYNTFMDGEQPMTNQLKKLCAMPIDEIRKAAVELVAAIARQKWAPEELKKINANIPVHQIGNDV